MAEFSRHPSILGSSLGGKIKCRRYFGRRYRLTIIMYLNHDFTGCIQLLMTTGLVSAPC
jgi:hypothetical protein